MRVSEIRVKRIRVNQGLGVLFFHSIKLPFDAEVDEKFLNVI